MSRTLSGARVVFKLNNQVVLFANAVSYEVDHGLEPFYQLDDIVAAEYYETQYKVSFSVNMFRAPNLSAQSQSFMPTVSEILQQPELEATLLDQITLRPIFTATRLKCNTESFSANARELLSSNLTFVGIRLKTDFNDY